MKKKKKNKLMIAKKKKKQRSGRKNKKVKRMRQYHKKPINHNSDLFLNHSSLLPSRHRQTWITKMTTAKLEVLLPPFLLFFLLLQSPFLFRFLLLSNQRVAIIISKEKTWFLFTIILVRLQELR